MSAEARLTAFLQDLVGERHPFSSPRKLKETEDYLAEQFRQLALNVNIHPFEALGGTYYNVIGTACPADAEAQRESPFIVGAHFDTVEKSPGADDNASGLAVLLEVAQSLRQTILRRPVRFIAFCLEEEDLLGSRSYSAYLRATGQEILGALVLECVGHVSKEEGSQKSPPGIPLQIPTVGNFLAVIGNQNSQSLTMAIEKAMKPRLPVIPLVLPGNGELLPDARRSDHTSFWEQGFPAVMLTDTANFRNPHYHRPSDTLDTLDLEFLASVAEAVTMAVLSLTGSEKTL